ncbi:MAG: helix-turn-helix transcriptional regulator [Micrococcales bacterium]|nr:helix-turn-helix transcriptional regulator [Micrococcales bacterium]
MVEASGVIARVRSARQLTMNALADVSGVPVSTISRIESGKVEPTWAMMSRLVAAAGFRLEPTLTETTTDEPLAGILRRLNEAQPGERERIVRRFPAAARLAQVARRPGARRVALLVPLGEAVTSLVRQDQSPVVSSLEAFLRDASQTRSFTPVVYVNDPATVNEFTDATSTSLTIMFLLPTTDNVRVWAGDVDGVRMTSREWALLDSLASPGRQPDATMYLLDELTMEPVS